MGVSRRHQAARLNLTPQGVRQRLQGQLGDFKFGGPARFVAILFSIVLGIATHLVVGYIYPSAQLAMVAMGVDAEGG